MKQAMIHFFKNKETQEIFYFLMLLKELTLRYNRYQEAYLKAANPVLLRDLAIERNSTLNSLLAELRTIDGLEVPPNVRLWQANVNYQISFAHQLFQVLSDSEVRKAVNQ